MMLGLVPSPAAQQIPVGLGRLRASGFEGLGQATFWDYVMGPSVVNGEVPVTDVNAEVCSSDAYYALSNCWGYSQAAWGQANAVVAGASTLPAPLATPALTQAQVDTIGASADPTAAMAAAIQTQSNLALTATQAQDKAWAATIPDAPVPPAIPSLIPSVSTSTILLMVGGGLLLFFMGTRK